MSTKSYFCWERSFDDRWIPVRYTVNKPLAVKTSNGDKTGRGPVHEVESVLTLAQLQILHPAPAL